MAVFLTNGSHFIARKSVKMLGLVRLPIMCENIFLSSEGFHCSSEGLWSVFPIVALIRACNFEHFLGFLLDFDQQLHSFIKQKHVLSRSACHQSAGMEPHSL